MVGWIRQEMRAAECGPATVLASTPEHRVPSSARKAAQVMVRQPVRSAVVGLLGRIQPRIEAHFGQSLDGLEEPQFLRYGVGDHFVAHQDGNTPLLYDESRFRRVSVVIFLSAAGTFGGGSLVLHNDPPLTFAPAPGTLVAFRSETTHEVVPITHGERLSIVSWYRG